MKLCVLRPSILPKGTLQPGKKTHTKKKHQFNFNIRFY